MPAGLGREAFDPGAEFVQHGDLAALVDRVHRVQPQSVEAVIAQPEQRILDREGPHVRNAIVDRIAPRRMRVGEEGWRVAAEKIALRPEVIVDDVEEHHQPAQMRRIDQGLEIIRAPIGAVGRVPQHPVIAPVALACEIGKRQQFERGDPALHEVIELVDGGAVGALLGEGPDMGLDQHGLGPGPSAPVGGPPCILRVVDHLAGAEDVVRLEGGCGVGHVDLVVDPEFVTRARGKPRDISRKPAIGAALHGAALREHEIDALGRRRPQPKRNAVRGRPGAELAIGHDCPAKASTERGGALLSAPGANSAVVCTTSVVLRTCCQLL